MDHQRISAVPLIDAGAEQHTFPKVADDRQMMVEIELGYIGENVADHVVGHRTRIELAHQQIDVIPVCDVLFHVRASRRWCRTVTSPRARSAVTFTASNTI